MNKSQITLAAVGGVAVLGALVLGYLIWDAASVKGENAESLEAHATSAGDIVRKLPVKPVKSELKVYERNASAYDAWRTNAQAYVSRGDFFAEATTPAAFKTAIVGDARRLSGRSGCLDGKFVKGEFGFGFKDYVTGGALPPERDLKRLQREWSDVMTVLETLVACGSNEVGVLDVRMGATAPAASAASAEEEKPKQKGKKNKRAKAKAKVAAEAEAEKPAGGAAVSTFTVDFLARPSVLVKALNAFATNARFIVVENVSFVRERDEIAEHLGGDGKKQESASASGRRRRRGGAAAETPAVEPQAGPVTDPATAPYLKVTMAFSVHDFGSLEN